MLCGGGIVASVLDERTCRRKLYTLYSPPLIRLRVLVHSRYSRDVKKSIKKEAFVLHDRGMKFPDIIKCIRDMIYYYFFLFDLLMHFTYLR